MYRRPSTMAKGEGRYCSRACRNRAHPPTGPRGPLLSMRGSRNPAWKGGVTYRRKHGLYGMIKYVRCPPEFLSMARADGYVMEHRLVMARMAGRPLSRTEVVHHEDHDPTRNAEANLELWPDNRTHKLWEHGRDVGGAAVRWCPAG
jgi:hypothetical protein